GRGHAAARRHGLGADGRGAARADQPPAGGRPRRRPDVPELQCRDRLQPRRRALHGRPAAARRSPAPPEQARGRQQGHRPRRLTPTVAARGPVAVPCAVRRRVVRARGSWMDVLARIGFGLFGLAVLIGVAWLFSSHKRHVDWRLVATGVGLQIGFAALVLLVPGGRDVFDALGNGFVRLLGFVNVGSEFIFGTLMDTATYGFIFAFQVLPTIIFFAAFMSVLYHLGVMQAIVRGMAWAITKVMNVSGAETTSVSASVFIGQTEAPLTVRPYISR